MRSALALLLLALGVFAAFAPALTAGFVNWDDPDSIVDNAQLRGLAGEHLAWMFTTVHTGPYQPLSWLTLALDVARSGGEASAPAIHATSVALHFATAAALFFVARRLFRAAGAAGERRIDLAAAFAALLFAVHPLRCESVAWATERRDVLYGLFLVLAVGAWLRWAGSERARSPRRVGALGWALAVALAAGSLAALLATTQRPGADARFVFAPLGVAASALAFAGLVAFCGRGATRWYALAVLAFGVSLLAKGAGLTLAAVLLVLDVWPLRRERRWADLAFEKLPFAVLGAAFGALATWGQAALPEALARWSEHTLAERVAQSFYGLAFYPLKTLAPFGLLPIYELPDVLSLTRPPFVYALLGVLALSAASIALSRRAPALLASFAVFALLVAPMLGLAQVGPQLVADRYSYVPCMPFALLAAGALLLGTRGVAARAAPFAAFALVAALGVLTWRQAAIWRDSEALWSHVLAARPDSAVANAGLGALLEERGFAEPERSRRRELMDGAAEHFERAQRVRGEARFCSNLSVIHNELSRLDALRENLHLAKALDFARKALELAAARGLPAAEHRLALGTALLAVERFDEAAAELEQYVSERPQHYLGWANLGVALTRLRRPAEGANALRRATELRPAEPSLWWFLGEALEQQGERAAALDAYRRFQQLAPERTEVADKLRTLQNGAGGR